MTEHGQQEEDEQVDNAVDKMMRYEQGDMTFEESIEFFQELVDSGLAWQLQGSYGRMAHALIEQGFVHEARVVSLDD